MFRRLSMKLILCMTVPWFAITVTGFARVAAAKPSPGPVIIINRTDTLQFPGQTEIVLQRTKSNIIFDLSAFNFTDYQYFLEGFDKTGITRKNGIMEYTNLPGGKYIMHISCRGGENNTALKMKMIIKVHPHWYLSSTFLLLVLTIIFLSAVFAYYQMRLITGRKRYQLEQIIGKRTEDLIIEKEKTEALLANILPGNTADEIIASGKATKMKYNFVTVLFSDIQGFTKIAEEVNPELLIDELDEFFFHFDSVVEKYGIEKIKTIGDAYMCAGGIPDRSRTNPVEVVLAALEMMEYIRTIKENPDTEGMKNWNIRIGIHTGTVIAGVVGHKKLSYDIWGDTVNTASRMESSCDGGKINISGTTHEFVREFFACSFRGKMPVKYKGDVEMYYVDGIVEELSDIDGKPNRRFFLKMQIIRLQDMEDMVMKLFDEEAPPDLYFHNTSLMKSISNQAEILATAESLGEAEFVSLKLAAIFLITGYIFDYNKPDEESVRLLYDLAPKYKFSHESIETAAKLVDGFYRNKSDSLAGMILHDAGYDYLGRVDFLKLSERLYREKKGYGYLQESSYWKKEMVQLLNDHEFLTSPARLLRSIPKKEQITGLMTMPD